MRIQLFVYWNRQIPISWWLSQILQVSFVTILKRLLTRVYHERVLRFSIVAYKQPITRAEVDDIRGVNSSGAIAKLQAFDLIQEAGKKDAVGRPNLYATTDYFLDYMGINSLDELVAIDQLELEEQETSLFREDAPEELEDLDN